jgi:hypothetical protein
MQQAARRVWQGLGWMVIGGKWNNSSQRKRTGAEMP